MTVYRAPSKAASNRSLGNLDGTSAGIGGTDTVRVQAGSGDFLKATPGTVDAGYVAGSAPSSVSNIVLRNVGQGAGVYARKESDGVTYSFRRLASGGGVTVSEVGDTIFFAADTGVHKFLELLDVPATYEGANGKVVTVDEANGRLIFTDIPVPEVVTNFLALTDTPDSFAGQGGKYLTVNETTGQIEFTSLVITTPVVPNRITYAPVPPTNPVPLQGDGWWNTTDGGFFLFYSDVNSGQWVESGSSEPATTIEEVNAYDYGAFYDGQPGSSEVIYRWRAPRPHRLAANFDGCLFTCGTNPRNVYTCAVWINGVQVGTWTLNTAGAASMVSVGGNAFDIPANQEIKIVGPVQTDATLADLVISFKGERY